MNSIHIAINLIRRQLGSWREVGLYLLLPALVVSLIIGLLGRLPAERTWTVYYLNHDDGPAGRYVLHELGASGLFRLQEAPERTAAGLRADVSERRTPAGLEIPAGFSQSIREGKVLPLEVLEVTGSEASSALTALSEAAAGRAVEAARGPAAGGRPAEGLEEALRLAEERAAGVKVNDYGWHTNPASGTASGILILFMLTMANGSVATVVKDRNRRTMARLFAAPVPSGEIALGHFLGGFLLGTVQIVFVLAVTRYGMGFDYGTGFLAHFTVLEALLLALLGLTSAVAGGLRRPDSLTTVQALVGTPTCMLGGCFWPVDLMPEAMQKLSRFVPQSWALSALRTLTAGGTLAGVGLHLAVLVLFAVVLLGIGAAVLKPAETGESEGR
ncbi:MULTISPECIES: ABC transporter permease [Paenibacillus]|uniref:ABC transporter permease n=1 Tax=Paenibacillus TaxID=44249 RepID=UPI0022B8694F|nr:ABC transporter permease [Paenibacillus caseinilyticus]MCZ8520269.1 ABC transporter permease [Paenibacillus caseinilyticus]